MYFNLYKSLPSSLSTTAFQNETIISSTSGYPRGTILSTLANNSNSPSVSFFRKSKSFLLLLGIAKRNSLMKVGSWSNLSSNFRIFPGLTAPLCPKSLKKMEITSDVMNSTKPLHQTPFQYARTWVKEIKYNQELMWNVNKK